MRTVTSKTHILEEAGYVFNFERGLYVNRAERKAFSVEFAEDHDEAEIEARITEPAPPSGEWCFYFNRQPSNGVRQQLSALLG
jgi:hypothetical protein